MQIPFFRDRAWRSLAAAVFLASACATSAHAAGTVGTGTPASCTEAALDTALSGGGNVTFNCGGSATIVLTATKNVTVDTSIDGGGVIALNGNASVQHFHVSGPSNFSLTGLTLYNGKSAGQGGALLVDGAVDVVLNNVALNTNTAATDGGAIAAMGGTHLSLTGIIANGNQSGGNGGAIYAGDSTTLSLTRFSASNNAGTFSGGAVSVTGTSLIIDSSAFSGNSISVFGGSGGAVLLNPITAATYSIINSTFEANSSGNNGTGGALSLVSASTGTVNNSTLANNTGEGTIEVAGTSKLTLTNTIISNTINNRNCLIGANATLNDGSGNNGHNLQFGGTTSQSCGATLTEADPMLGPMANNGGFTNTMALLTGSPAINAGNNATCAFADQRGIARPIGLNCDIGAYEATPPTIINGPAFGGTADVPYTFTYLANGSPAITFALTAGALPPGLTISTGGTISGTPTTPGTYTGTVTASNGSLPNATQDFNIVIAGGAVAPTISNGPPPNGMVNTPYTFTYLVSGSPSIALAVSAGTLPPGLTLLSTGQLNGTPSATGTFTGTVTASNGTAPDATQDFSIVITAAAVAPTITNGPAPNGTVGSAYSFAYVASGSAPIAFGVTAGALPPGLSLSSAGVISGTPSATGTYAGTVAAANGTQPDATQAFSITIAAAQPPAAAVAAPSLGAWGMLAMIALLAIAGAPRRAMARRKQRQTL